MGRWTEEYRWGVRGAFSSCTFLQLVSGFISRHKGRCGPSFHGTDKPQKSGNAKYYKGNEKEKWDRAEVWGCIILGKVVRKDFSEKVIFELSLE